MTGQHSSDEPAYGANNGAERATRPDHYSGRFLNFRNFACQRTQITSISITVLSHRGACARHERGAGCGGRGSARDERGLLAYGEVVWF